MPPPMTEFAKWINPVLCALAELGGSARPSEVVERVAINEAVPEDVLNQVNAAGGLRFPNQVHWARYYLVETGYIDRSRRGVWKLTEKGSNAGQLSSDELNRLLSDVRQAGRANGLEVNQDVGRLGLSAPVADDDAAPEERSTTSAKPGHRAHLLDLLRSLHPGGFERLCQRLLREAGFEQVSVTGRSGDGGIDGHGVLAINAFVSFRVLFQCKRYSGSVTPSQVRDFRGAMLGRADKGLMLTTGVFTVEARREATRDGVPPIELVDGEGLLDLFENLELGLKPVTAYVVDELFFAEYR